MGGAVQVHTACCTDYSWMCPLASLLVLVPVMLNKPSAFAGCCTLRSMNNRHRLLCIGAEHIT